MKTKSKPSPYDALSFHAVRALSALSSIIVTGIIFYFSSKLYADKFKIPWTFIIVVLASLLNVVALALTAVIHCCATLSPILNLILNIPILLLWLVAFGLLAYNMGGTLAHSCSLANWATSVGVMVCNTYKTLFAFVVLGMLAQVAQIVLDVRARRRQNRRGAYDKMHEDHLLLRRDGKEAGEDEVRLGEVQRVGGTGAGAGAGVSDAGVVAHGEPEFRDEIPGWRPGYHHQQQQKQTAQVYGHDETSSIHMSDFGHSAPSYRNQHQYDAGSHYAGGYESHGDYQAYRDHDRRY